MASNRWIGRAQAVADVKTVTIANTWTATNGTTDTITLTINQKSLVVSIGSLVTTAQVATTIQQAWENASFTDTTALKTPADGGQDIAEHAEITATVSGSVVTLTHDQPGTPFVMTVTEVTDGNGTAAGADSTSATGPNHIDNPDNWDAGSLPITGDDVFVDDSSISILYALGIFFGTHTGAANQAVLTDSTQNWVPSSLIGQVIKNDTDGSSTTVTANDATTVTGVLSGGTDDDWDTGDAYTMTTLASLTISRNYTGEIGLPKQNAGGYVEYRPDYLGIAATTVTIGRGEGSGSSQIKLDTGTAATAITVESTGSPPFGLEAFLWKGVNITNTLEVHEGTVGVAVFGGEVATILTLRNTAGEVRCSDRTVLDTANTVVTNESGSIALYSNTITLNNSSGTILFGGSATLTTLNLEGGTVNYQSSGTIATANIGGFNRGATLDFSGDNSARIITVCNLLLNGRIVDPLQTVTYSGGILPGAGVELISAA